MSIKGNWLAALSLAVLSWSLVAADGAHKDGYSLKNGKVVMSKGGNEVAVTAEVTLHNGSRLTPDGFIIDRAGKRERFQESRWITLDGDYFDVADADITATDNFDGYYYEGGKVYVMRDHRPEIITVEITLTDGSRISPDGTFILKDGTRNRMSEGQRVSKQGKPVEGKAKTSAESVNASHKAVESAKTPAQAPAAEREKAKTPETEKAPAVNEKTAAPEREKTAAPEREKTAAPEREKSAAPEKKESK